jgi:beta-N-acetylhexosaminidase
MANSQDYSLNYNPATRLGRHLMLAFEGTEPLPWVGEWLRERRAAGFTLFRALNVESPAQVRALTDALQRLAGDDAPLLIAGDQEGGQLIALGAETTQFPGNMALGATGDPALAKAVGYATGREMAAMGVNINYAPVCDLNTNPANPSLGIRAFGDDAVLSAALAFAYTDGLQQAGVAATVKHFPGKGDAKVDSHYTMPVIDHSRERLMTRELLPFREAMNAGAKLIMTGHFAIPALNNRPDLPATLSREVMHGLVRDEMGFAGVVITDALDMGAISQGVGQIIDVLAALRAGVDLLLLTADREAQERVYAGIHLAYRRGLLREADLRASGERIRDLQRWVGQQKQPEMEAVSCAAHRQLARQVSERAVTLLRKENGLLPLRLSPDARVAAIMPTPTNLTPADTSATVAPGLAEALRRYHGNVIEFVTPFRPSAAEIAAFKEQAKGFDLLVIGTINAAMHEEQAALAKELLATGVPAITVSLRTPYDLSAYPEARTHICTYSILPPAMGALAAALWGAIPFLGRLPVVVPGLFPLGFGLTGEAVRG